MWPDHPIPPLVATHPRLLLQLVRIRFGTSMNPQINPPGPICGVHEGGSNEHKCTKMRSPNGAKLAKMLHTTFTDQAKPNEVIDLQQSRSQWWHKRGETTREKLKSLPQSKTNLKSDIDPRISKIKCVLLEREDSEKRPEVREVAKLVIISKSGGHWGSTTCRHSTVKPFERFSQFSTAGGTSQAA